MYTTTFDSVSWGGASAPDSKTAIPSENQYFNLREQNDSKTEYQKAALIVHFDQVFLEEPSKYKCAITSFTVPTENIPILEFEPGAWKIAWSFGGNTIIENVPFISWDPASTPSDEDYYHVYDFQQIIDMLNTCLVNLFARLAELPGFTPTIAPWFIFDTDTGRFTLVGEEQYWSNSGLFTATAGRFWLNYGCWNLFQNFRRQYYYRLGTAGNPNATEEWFYLPITRDNEEYKLEPPSILYGPAQPAPYNVASVAYDVVGNIQTFNNLSVLTDITAISICSNATSIRPQLEAALLSQAKSTGAYAASNTLQQFAATSVTGIDVRSGAITFFPTSEFQRIDILQLQPLQTLDIYFQYIRKNGTKHDIYLSPGGYCSARLMFERFRK